MKDKKLRKRLKSIDVNLAEHMRRTEALEGMIPGLQSEFKSMKTSNRIWNGLAGLAITVFMGIIGWILSLQLHVLNNING